MFNDDGEYEPREGRSIWDFIPDRPILFCLGFLCLLGPLWGSYSVLMGVLLGGTMMAVGWRDWW